MLYGPMEPNERFRARRAEIRRRRRRRRAAALGLLLLVLIAVGVGARYGMTDATKATQAGPVAAADLSWVAPTGRQPRPLPVEIRGVHVTGPLASIEGKLQQYMALERLGLNTIQLDVKDEGGEIGFAPAGVRLASRAGAARSYYKPGEVARLAHKRGLYLIGRVVTFQDPLLSAARPDLAIRRPDGSVWTTGAGLGWLNPYDRRVWDYAVSVAEAAARAGFDEIMFDYVRFPSDGDVSQARYPGKTTQRPGQLIADFVAYAQKRLKPLGVRVSTALFGLAATRDMGIGQNPRLVAKHVDTVYPMSYPALYGSGELGLDDPAATPGETVFRTLAHYRRQLRGRSAHLVTWVQDFSGYTLEDVRAQIDAARLQGVKGYLLWNAAGVYTKGALAPASTG
ncbi:MAG TPA: putative glycoside hydrolase [Gaiellaceae bacterium]|jgi:hypothetical protein